MDGGQRVSDGARAAWMAEGVGDSGAEGVGGNLV